MARRQKGYFVRGPFWIPAYHPGMERKETYPLEAVFPRIVDFMIPDKKAKVDFDGDMIRMNSRRLHAFRRDNAVCQGCGLRGAFFAKERMRNSEVYHLSLYGIDTQGNEVLFTRDHVLPHSRGGHGELDNLQTLCYRCNEAKGNRNAVPAWYAVAAGEG